jgi:ubiquinone/menaquinone biosynthesis C-methylase UbiE
VSNDDTQKEQIAGLYHRVASTYGHVGPSIFAYAGQHLVEHVGMTEGAQVLDIGAGRGANLFPAAETVGPHGQVIGIDLAPGMVQETAAEIERRNLPHVSMLQMDAEHLTFPDASFDAVLCGFAIFLFPHLEQALSEFFRVLRPGGKVGITVAQDLDALSHWYGEHITEYHTRYQIPLCAGGGKGSNYSELPRYLTHTGLIHIQVLQEQVDFVYTNAQEWWHSRWTHGPRYALEQMTPEVLKQFREEVFARLAQEAQSQSIHETLRLQYILADKEV